ncbi:chitin deacetylase [Zalerion maritima]|uniref:Chitin deacetylase n=1 Tax=Zalerion maritima TaxID=339359 RepID=A0AAD5WTT5_9PEZI|nr:chitin deacetylase [Zalerion maritima]
MVAIPTTAHGVPSIKVSRNAINVRFADPPAVHDTRDLHKRAECGESIGSCSPGQCCSENGWCGTTGDFCGGPQCQLDYSDSCDTAKSPSGESTLGVDRSPLGTVPYGTEITQCTSPGTMALTFDDGPWEYTSMILDILADRGVKATFFVSGNNLGKGMIDDESTQWPSILRRMHSDNHHIASHTWTHRDLNQVNPDIRESEMVYNEMAFRNIFGWFPTYMRPPYAYCYWSTGCTDTVSALGYHIINMDIDTKDYLFTEPATIDNAKDRFASLFPTTAGDDGHIALAHDIHYQTVVNLTDYMIDLSLSRGYTLATVGGCLGDPEENWYRNADGGSSSSAETPALTPTPSPSVSPDQTCGDTAGYTCQGSAFGACCSYYGYCGASAAYCGTGCQAQHGSCDTLPSGLYTTANGLCGAQFDATCMSFVKWLPVGIQRAWGLPLNFQLLVSVG